MDITCGCDLMCAARGVHAVMVLSTRQIAALAAQVHQYLDDHGTAASTAQIESFVEAVKV